MRYIAILAVIAGFSIAAAGGLPEKEQSSYCKGFEDGYPAGYCYRDPYCITPITPICPVRGYDEENTYKGGYERGFVDGYNDSR